MKVLIPMIILFLSTTGLIVWDGIFTQKTFDYLENESNSIYEKVLTTDISDEDLQKRIFDLNDYWTEKMDILSVSISRKDMQPISDYLQYLCASIINNSQEDAVTYSRLLHYNAEGLQEVTGIDSLNLL